MMSGTSVWLADHGLHSLNVPVTTWYIGSSYFGCSLQEGKFLSVASIDQIAIVFNEFVEMGFV